MSYFNKPITTPKIENHENGTNFVLSPELELATLLTCASVKGNYYEDDTVTRLRSLLAKNNNKEFIEFAAKATVYTRKIVGSRTLSHISTALLTEYTSGQPWAKTFYNQVINRVDDMSETISVYNLLYRENKKIGSLPKQMFKGFRKYINSVNYHLASKYQMKGKPINLIDLVNLLHAKTKWTEELMTTGTLKPAETKEVKLSEAGQISKKEGFNEEQTNQLKADVLSDLLDKGMPYKALTMHLVRIVNETNHDVILKACDLLTNKEAIVKSLIHPLELLVAYQEVMRRAKNQNGQFVFNALIKAIELCYNLPEIMENAKLDGRTLVMLDISGSMTGMNLEIAGLVAVILLKLGNTDLIRYHTSAERKIVNTADSITTIFKEIAASRGGTVISSAFELIKDTKYDRVVVITDQQDFGSDSEQGNKLFNKWRAANNPLAHMFSVDVAGYGNSVFNNNSTYIHTFSGFDKNIVEQITNNKTDIVKIIKETIKF